MVYRWDERYDQDEFLFGTEPNDFLREQAHRIPAGGKVLCLGDGEGRNGVWLAEQGYQVTSVDLSQVGLDKTQRFAKERGVTIETIYADLADWPIEPQAWDGIVSIFCHMMPDERKRMHPRIVKGLKPGGVFILEAYTPDQIDKGTGGPSNPDLLVTAEDIIPEIDGLEISIAHNLEREVIEGTSHNGMSCVAQIVASRRDLKSGEIDELINASIPRVIKQLTRSIPNTSDSQVKAWGSEIEVLQQQMSQFVRESSPDYGVSYILEYELPKEAGRRPDVILLFPGLVLVLEFKGYGIVRRSDLDQAAAYARDLSGYHSECSDLSVEPVLVLCSPGAQRKQIDGVEVVPAKHLAAFLTEKVHLTGGAVPDLTDFINGEYGPLPTLVHAARMLFHEEALPFVKRAHSAGVNVAVEKILDDARIARERNIRRLVLVTGVPGAGKTLVGLQVAHSAALEEGYRFGKRKSRGAPATFLSGNGPLVQVLQKALESTAFVQDMHRFIREYGLEKPDRVPFERLIVFDEAQRAWDQHKVNNFYSKKLPGIDTSLFSSEPQMLTRIADRLEDGAVVLALVGEGQEIHSGEESGMAQWAEAVAESPEEWSVLGPPGLQEMFESYGIDYTPENILNLDTGLRYHAAEDLHQWVSKLLDEADLRSANKIAQRLRNAAFPIYVTRNLPAAQGYVSDRFSGECMRRYGQIASSKSHPFLTKYGLDTGFQATKRIRVGDWFNADPGDDRSCCQLKDTITEFQCQGLEVDFSIVCWGNDFTWTGESWQVLNKRKSALIQNPQQLRMNAYRVLLTRSREGMILYVPADECLNLTYQALVDAGAQPVQT